MIISSIVNATIDELVEIDTLTKARLNILQATLLEIELTVTLENI